MSQSIIVAFWMGLLGGVHCFAMCGGLVGILSGNLSNNIKENSSKIMLYHLAYNLGRIGSYVLMGLAFAVFSSVLNGQLHISLFEQSLRIFSAVVVIFVGFFILGWRAAIAKIERLGQGFWQKLQPIGRRLLPIKNLSGAYFFGLLWGGIPCGLVYGALSLTLGASSIAEGGLIMLAFGIGTLPALLAMAGFATSLVRFFQHTLIRKMSGIIIILLGFWSLIMPLKSMFMQH